MEIAALVALAAATVGSCDECDYGAVICRDNAILTCQGNSAPLTWMKRTDCGDKLCRVATSPLGTLEGVCSVEDQPNPLCRTADPRFRSMCAAGRVVECQDGYLVSVFDTCAGADLCIDPDQVGRERLGQPFCAVSTTPDPRCPLEPPGPTPVFVTRHCATGHLIGCALGLLASDQHCGAEELCYTPAPPSISIPSATCVASRSPDPRCANRRPKPSEERNAVICDGDLLLTCVDDLLADVQTCGSAGCELIPGYAEASCRGTTPRR